MADPLPDRGPEGVEVDPDPVAPPPCGCEISTPRVLKVRGTVRLKSTAELAAGATVVLADADAKQMFTAITDEVGEFELELQAGNYDITVYYMDATMVVASKRLIIDDVQLPVVVVDDTNPPFTCWDILPLKVPPELTSQPRLGATISRRLLPIARDRTHLAWIAPVALADPARSVTTVEGGRRFTRAPGIPTVFVEEVATAVLDVPIERAQGGGGATAVALRYGSNQRHAEARFVGGLERGADGSAIAETLAGGPIATDHLWFAGGLVARRDGALASDAMVRLDAKGAGHDAMLAGLAHDDGEARSGWSGARWQKRLFDARLELGATATAELLELPQATAPRELSPTTSASARRLDRAGGGASASLRFRGHGYHLATATASSGIGERDGTRHTDASYAVGDDWWIGSHWTVTAGVRLEQRTYGDARTRVVAPRVALEWDPTGDQHGEVFVAYQRVPLLDDGLPGDWKSLQVVAVDELYAGVSYRRPSGDTMVGIAAHQRDDRTGGDAWLRRETARSVVHLQATSLDRVATLIAQRKLRDRAGTLVSAGVSARVGEERSEGGVALGLKRSPSRSELTAEITGEAYAGTDGPGGRIVLGILW